MVKTIEILGIEVDTAGARELLQRVEQYLVEPGMHTIETVTAPMLLACQSNPFLQEALNGLDMAMIGDTEILAAAGIDSPAKKQEIENHEFFHEFMKRIVRNKKSIFLLGETQQEIDELLSYIQEEYDRVKIAGMFAMEECIGDMDGAINEVNGTTPDVIISLFSSPFQEEFLQKERLKLNASIWYGISKNYIRTNRIGKVETFVKRMIHKDRLVKSINEYDEEVETDIDDKK